MKPEELKAWRKWMRWSQRDAAEALGISRASLQLYEKGQLPVPKPVELACFALEKGVRSYSGPSVSSQSTTPISSEIETADRST